MAATPLAQHRRSTGGFGSANLVRLVHSWLAFESPPLSRPGSPASGPVSDHLREMDLHVRTFSPKPSDITRNWIEIDATDLTLGRLATEVAFRLRGKHKPIFTPHVDTGDFIVIVNADKVYLEPTKAGKTFFHTHSGFPGGIRSASFAQRLATKPEQVIMQAVKGMLPKNTLGRQQLTKLKVYAGPTHPHAAQQPVKLELPQARRKPAA
jgi:large subunit ribosomal protein L13